MLLLITAALGLVLAVAAQPTARNLRTLVATFGGCLLAVAAVRWWPGPVGTALWAVIALALLWALAWFALWPLRALARVMRGCRPGCARG